MQPFQHTHAFRLILMYKPCMVCELLHGQTKFFSLFVFPSWFLKLPIASSHNYKIMAKWILFCYLFVTFDHLSRAQKYNITQSGIAVLNGCLTLTITIPDMKRPVVWKCRNYKYECDKTCADGPDYKVTQDGDTSTLWIKKVTEKCLTWRFDDDNLNAADIDLKIKSFSSANIYKITQSGIAVLNRNLTLSITIPNMKRPVVWKCQNYKYECDKTCADGPDYKVTQDGDTSKLWIKKVTEKCSTWKFDDDNLNIGRIDLEIKNPKPKPHGLTTLEIVGIIFGSLILAAILVGLAYFGYKYFKNNH
ncbi:uncharacterized protein LOC115225116 isoform X6 [Octopus sinensis]|uniref:Uncharacterized protein LOC115225116 isoform X6 n=1 Tax=Octopus sinensis TaxID=2607531 RepID=A0A6P7TRE0_9MOLL|nr:uncharacterized protein LOC115225116 isoform X6 [Octopus sinensis]